MNPRGLREGQALHETILIALMSGVEVAQARENCFIISFYSSISLQVTRSRCEMFVRRWVHRVPNNLLTN